MSEAFKVCPICETANHRNAAFCMNCGASLAGVKVVSTGSTSEYSPTAQYDYRYGETDLFEGSLRRTAQRYLFAIVLTLSLLMLGGAALIFAPRFAPVNNDLATGTSAGVTFLQTNTPRPTFSFPTVTQGTPTRTLTPTDPPQPTATLTPTREPCMQEVLPDDGLISMVSRCGHRDLFVITQVIELNDLANAGDIRPGEILEIPWPTETIDPNVTPTLEPTQVAALTTADGEAADVTVSNNAQVSADLTQLADPFFIPTATLPPGIMYHRVQPDDNAIIISDLYHTNVEVLSQLNPEITFSQCDFGQTYGGPRCIIPLAQGQLVRVPAPTPTPTLSPTPSGSETATPTPTATYNAPFAVSPDNFAYFRKDQVVTLRWGATGVLLDGTTYQLNVERLNDGLTFSATTSDLVFLVPGSWQGSGTGRYEYRWTISVIDTANPRKLNYTTQPRNFTWEGIGEEK